MTTLTKAALAGVALAGVGGAALIWRGTTRWAADTGDALDRLRAAAQVDTAPPFTVADLEGLPEPVARYFRAVLRDGQPMVSLAHVTWTGEFNMGSPGADRWLPFTAEQAFVPGAPGMVWDARIRMAPGLTVRVRDSLVDGTGAMYGSLLGVFPVIDRRDRHAMALASAQRYLAEAVWFPTALLPRQGVTWSAVHDSCATASLNVGDVIATVEFHFDAGGLVESSFVPDRLYDDGRAAPHPAPWQGRVSDYRWEGGMRVPGTGVAEWLLTTGTYAYWRGQVTALVVR